MKISKSELRKVGASALGVFLGLALFAGMMVVHAAWSEPASQAPSGNVAAPVNVGDTAQVKSGPFGVSGLLTAFANLVVENDNPYVRFIDDNSVDTVNTNQYVIGRDGYLEVAAFDGAAYKTSAKFSPTSQYLPGNVGIGNINPTATLEIGSPSNTYQYQSGGTGETQSSGGSCFTITSACGSVDNTFVQDCPNNFSATASDPSQCSEKIDYDADVCPPKDEGCSSEKITTYQYYNKKLVVAGGDLKVNGNLTVPLNGWDDATGYDYSAGNIAGGIVRGTVDCPQGYYVIGVQVVDGPPGNGDIDGVRLKCAKL